MIQTRFLAVAVFALVLLAGSLFQNPGRQNARWTGPYFSAAANFQLGRGFSIDIEDVRHFCQLKDYDAEKRYRFRSSNDLSPYNANPFGYVYMILLATTLFGWFAADIESLLLLQILVHAAATVFVMMRLKSWAARVAFVAAYGINPLILHFVTLDFYFFWQVVPSLALITLHSKPQLRSSPLWLVWAAVLGIVREVTVFPRFPERGSFHGFPGVLGRVREAWLPRSLLGFNDTASSLLAFFKKTFAQRPYKRRSLPHPNLTPASNREIDEARR